MVRMSSDTPWPRQWRAPNSALGIGLAVFCLACAGLFVALAASGDPVGIALVIVAPIFAGFALSGVATWVGVRARPVRSVRTRLQPDGIAALAFPYSFLATVAAFLVVVGLAAGVIPFLAAGLFSALDGDLFSWLWVLLFGLIGLFGLACLYGIARRRLVRGAVFLSPDGIVHRTWGADTAISWDAVLDVTPEESAAVTAYGNGPPSQVIRLSPYANAKATYTPRSLLWRPARKVVNGTALISGTVLGVNPALVYHTLRFYHRNPNARAELGTDAAVRRVRAGQVL